MALHSLIDEKKKALVRGAIAKGDPSLLWPKKKPQPDQKKDAQSRASGSGLVILIKKSEGEGVSVEDALTRANAENRIIASNKRLDQALVGSEEWKAIQEAFPCWSGTMTAYAGPGKNLGASIGYVDDKTGLRYVFPVPEIYRGEKDAILVSEHPDYTLEIDGNDRIVRAAQVGLVERFPAKDGWYLGDAQHGIPTGDEVGSDDSSARRLWRINQRVGPVARLYGSYYDDFRRLVGLNNRASIAFGVAVEAPERGAPNRTGDKP